MKFNPQYQTSEGTWFKDPVTEQDLSSATPRDVPVALTPEGKFIWPKVTLQDGQLVKIAFRLFTDEERTVYKMYRSKGKTAVVVKQDSGAHSHVGTTSTDNIRSNYVEQKQEPPRTTAKHTEPGTPSATTIKCLSDCDCTFGVWQFDGILYEMVGKRGTASYTPIPRSIIPREHRERLGIPV